VPWAWDDRICGVSPYHRRRSLSLLFRDYCSSSGRGRFKVPNVEADLQDRMSEDCMQILLTNDRQRLSWPPSSRSHTPWRTFVCTPEILNIISLHSQASRHSGTNARVFSSRPRIGSFGPAIMERNSSHWRDLLDALIASRPLSSTFLQDILQHIPRQPRQSG